MNEDHYSSQEYGYNHRAASEYLHLAATDPDNIRENLMIAKRYEKIAEGFAGNWRERLLSNGLISTVDSILAVLDAGVEP